MRYKHSSTRSKHCFSGSLVQSSALEREKTNGSDWNQASCIAWADPSAGEEVLSQGAAHRLTKTRCIVSQCKRILGQLRAAATTDRFANPILLPNVRIRMHAERARKQCQASNSFSAMESRHCGCSSCIAGHSMCCEEALLANPLQGTGSLVRGMRYHARFAICTGVAIQVSE